MKNTSISFINFQLPSLPLVQFLVLMIFFLLSGQALAQGQSNALSSIETEKQTSETAADSEHSFLILELFSSQACVFCPDADRLFAEYAQNPAIIALACHVDYFDVQHGSLAQPFCSERQNFYESRLRAGPNFTPQMVINGRYDVIGYKEDKVATALMDAQKHKAAAIKITRLQNGQLSLEFPKFTDDDPAMRADVITLWLAVLDKPHQTEIKTGNNKGQKISYHNIVSHLETLGTWQRGQTQLTLDFLKISDQASKQEIIILAQDIKNGAIYAAGRLNLQ